MMVKDLPIELFLNLAPFILLTEIALWPYFLFKSPTTIPCLLQAYMETIKGLSETLALRRKVQATWRVPAAYLRQFFIGF